ncbi:MAG: exodeoxyribonuclease III, partial [Myxococcota bacterium]
MPPAPLRVISWNVNGLRACAKKGFATWLRHSRAQIVGLQEVRALPEDLPPEILAPRGWHTHFAPAERKGYSGVGIYSRALPDHVESSLGVRRFDIEGRLQVARFCRLAVVNGYFPKGSGKDRDNSRVPYKLAFYRAVFERAERLRRSGRR